MANEITYTPKLTLNNGNVIDIDLAPPAIFINQLVGLLWKNTITLTAGVDTNLSALIEGITTYGIAYFWNLDPTNYVQLGQGVPICPPVNGALTQTVAGALAGATYFVRSTYVNSAGETLASPETSLAVSANNVLNVASPAASVGATGWNVYVSTATGTETRQNGANPIAIGSPWVEPNTGLVAGAALPGANTTNALINPLIRLVKLPDIPAIIRLDPATTIRVLANTGNCKLLAAVYNN